MGARDAGRTHLFTWSALSTSVILVPFALLTLDSLTPNHTTPPSNLKSSARQRFPLEISPDPVDLGILLPGQSAQATITLHNPGPHPVSVEQIETRCPCIRVEPASFKVAAGEFAEFVARFDPSHDPDFRGGLSIDVVGRSSRDFVLFRARVNLDIRVQNLAALQRHISSEKEGLR
jgi:hypothetical protein